ncbi:MAG TPA: DUF1329 domain-containing protein [Candidatus Limnocylindria bacterium]|nr:DUF1329 domain-containing protein [Candidatus Limnocylindria bacterium]
MRKRVIAASCLAGLLGAAVGRADALRPGVMLDQTTADAAADLLPPEIHAHYAKGEYKNPIVDFPDSAFQWDDGFAEATQWNRENLGLDAAKQPVDKRTGKRPDYITGHPFPDIREDDPDAGVKVIWNLLYQVYNGGNIHTTSSVDWIGRTGINRSAGQDGYFLYYDGQPKHYIPPNPNNFLSQFLAVTTGPADLQGTAALSHRFKDPHKRDLNWAYVPALRRVRAVSPSNRSDGFLGSDMSQDDGNFFDGKTEDFTWKLVGQREALRLTDPDALAGKVVRHALPKGGWRTPFPNNDRTAGFQVKDWTGVAWAPVAAGLARRKVWVVEGVPKDRYYLFGKLELWIDAYTYQGAWNRKFSWKGELLNTFQSMAPPSAPFNDKERWNGQTFGYQLAENVKLSRATLGGRLPPGNGPQDLRVPLEPSFFNFDALSRFGK